MKIDRLFSELVFLMNRDVVTARELADHFEVSIRTVQRDMDTLALAGIPLLSLRGAQGGYGIMKEYPVQRLLRDALVTIPAGGTAEIAKLVLARQGMSLFR